MTPHTCVYEIKTKRTGKKRNKGWFKKGTDARRSNYRFTKQDCRMGYWVTYILHPHLRDWLKMKILCYYHAKETANGPQEDRCARPGGDGNVAAQSGDDCPF